MRAADLRDLTGTLPGECTRAVCASLVGPGCGPLTVAERPRARAEPLPAIAHRTLAARSILPHGAPALIAAGVKARPPNICVRVSLVAVAGMESSHIYFEFKLLWSFLHGWASQMILFGHVSANVEERARQAMYQARSPRVAANKTRAMLPHQASGYLPSAALLPCVMLQRARFR